MAGTLLIFEDDAAHAKRCAEYLAELATKYIKTQGPTGSYSGDMTGIANKLADIIAVLEGNSPLQK